MENYETTNEPRPEHHFILPNVIEIKFIQHPVDHDDFLDDLPKNVYKFPEAPNPPDLAA